MTTGGAPGLPDADGPASQMPGSALGRPGRGAPALIDQARGVLRADISAYPGTMTFLDLVRKNKRQSAAMIVLGVALGGAAGGAVTVWSGGDASALLPSVVVGCIAALICSVLGAAWSWFGGASAVLAMSGAREVRKQDDPELFNVIDELRIAAGVPMPRVYIIDDSAMNAFATGRDPEHAAVAVTTGLRQKLSRDELQGVMAHEMSHVRHFDTRFALLMATMVGLIAFACDALFRIMWYGRGGRSTRDNKGGGAAMAVLFIVALVLAMLAPVVSRIIQAAYSRQREYLADAGAVELTRNPEGLASALLRLGEDAEPLVDTANRGTAHMYIVNPLRKMWESRQGMDSMFVSHPPIRERVARLLALAR